MPQLEPWDNLPGAARQHLIEGMRDRAISLSDPNQLRLWVSEGKLQKVTRSDHRVSADSSPAAKRLLTRQRALAASPPRAGWAGYPMISSRPAPRPAQPPAASPIGTGASARLAGRLRLAPSKALPLEPHHAVQRHAERCWAFGWFKSRFRHPPVASPSPAGSR
jgi:hypothetical protein